MYCSIISGAFHGMESYLVHVEVDVSEGLPCMDMVGYLSSEVKEARERVRVGIKNSGYNIPMKRITISLSPADIRKDGSAFDLPVALGVIRALGYLGGEEETAPHLKSWREQTIVLGEIGLDGQIKPVRGLLPILLKAAEEGIQNCVIPRENYMEASNVKQMHIYAVSDLKEAVSVYRDPEGVQKRDYEDAQEQPREKGREKLLDFNQIYGQEQAKRAAEIAAAGFHNLLLYGPPGSGKSMIAERISSIMPDMSEEECMEVTKIYSVAGLLERDTAMIRKRPYMSPHHTATAQALIGGGSAPRPGMVTLSHKGILFLDELPEFGRGKLDLLRQPMEDKRVQIARALYTCTYAADFMLVGAMNPCPCGYYPDRMKCSCKPNEINRYLNRISGPMLDRIDLSTMVGKLEWSQIREQSEKPVRGQTREDSHSIKKRVCRAVQIQKDRTGKFNSDLTNEEINKICVMEKDAERLLQLAYERYEMGVRKYNKIRKVARTIADLEGSENILQQHMGEALAYGKGLEQMKSVLD